MSLSRLMLRALLTIGIVLGGTAFTRAQQVRTASDATLSPQRVLERAGADGKYTFLLFYKADDAASQTASQVVAAGLRDRAEEADFAHVALRNPANRPLVDRFDVSRAPMPLVVAVAPNGAVTGMFSQKVSQRDIDGAFVTPTLMKAIKSLQAGKLVLVTVQGSSQAPAPVAVKGFLSDPHFKDRTVSLSMSAADPEESPFVEQMKIDPNTTQTNTVLIAPPAVMVGKFSASTSKDEIAAALARAGKCCDDPNCKHHQAPPRSATQPSQGQRKN